MPKVKIIFVQELYGDDDYNSIKTFREGITEWEEISPEDLDFLKRNISYVIHSQYPYFPVILLQDDLTIKDRLLSVKEEVARVRKEREAEELKRKEKQQAKIAKTLAQKRKIFEKLKEELHE